MLCDESDIYIYPQGNALYLEISDLCVNTSLKGHTGLRTFPNKGSKEQLC